MYKKFIFFLAVFNIFVTPFVFIWCLNTLFKLDVSYSFDTWLAVQILIVLAYMYRGSK